MSIEWDQLLQNSLATAKAQKESEEVYIREGYERKKEFILEKKEGLLVRLKILDEIASGSIVPLLEAVNSSTIGGRGNIIVNKPYWYGMGWGSLGEVIRNGPNTGKVFIDLIENEEVSVEYGLEWDVRESFGGAGSGDGLRMSLSEPGVVTIKGDSQNSPEFKCDIHSETFEVDLATHVSTILTRGYTSWTTYDN